MDNKNSMIEAINNNFKNKIYGLLCEREKERDWENFLDNLIIELLGVPEEDRTINYYKLLAKMSTLRFLRYEYFRSTIFDCMNLVGK